MNGVDVWRCPLFVPAVPRGKNRLVHLASFALSSLPVMIRQAFWRADVIIAIEPPLFCAPAAWLIARLSGAKCWLHIQDFEVDAAFELGIVRHGWLKRSVLACERWMMRRFNVVSTISQSMVARLHDKSISEPVLFPNWSDVSQLQYKDADARQFRSDHGVGAHACLCLYAGAISHKQGLETLLRAALKLPDYSFVICGDGATREKLQRLAEKLALCNLTFIPPQPRQRFSAMLAAADIHMVIQKHGAADLVMPSKLTNILAIGGLALVTAEVDSELGRLAEGEAACVYRCEPENIDALADAIRLLNAKPELSDKIRCNAKTYADDHIVMDQVLGQFEQRIKSLCHHGTH